MTVWEFLGDLGLGLATAAAVFAAYVVLSLVCVIIGDWLKRRREQRKDALINALDALLLAKRLREDREVADLYAAWELPTAPGSFGGRP